LEFNLSNGFGLFHGHLNFAFIGNAAVLVRNLIANLPRTATSSLTSAAIIQKFVCTSLHRDSKTQIATEAGTIRQRLLPLPAVKVPYLSVFCIAIADARGYINDAAVFLGFLRFQLAHTHPDPETHSQSDNGTNPSSNAKSDLQTDPKADRETYTKAGHVDAVLPPMPPVKGKMKMMGNMGK
jgi:hypothetical protein